MSHRWGRRDVLRTLVAAAGMPALVSAEPTRRTVGIIGGGMAGVSLAWLLDGSRDVVLLESRDTIGGNILGVEVDLDGQTFTVDLGAQYFHPGPYPLYTALLSYLGLLTAGGTHPFPASITLADPAEATPRFVSPVFWERTWPVLPPWNSGGLAAFGLGFQAAKTRELANESWALTLGDWLPTLGLTQAQWEGMLLPWAASIFSGSIEQARGLSARAAMIFAAKALPDNPLDPLLYYALSQGMTDVLQRMLDQCSRVQVLTGARVQQVWRNPTGGFTIACTDGRVNVVDEIVFASSGPGTLELLESLPGTTAQRAALSGIEFHDARLALHTDPIYAPPDPRLWSFLNCEVRGAHCEASMWMGRVLSDVPAATAARVWKSWVTHRTSQPAEILHEAAFKHMLPTPATLFAQVLLRAMQGRDGLWFAGGYTLPYDSQETALLSAIGVAIGLHITSSRLNTILTASPQSRQLLSAD